MPGSIFSLPITSSSDRREELIKNELKTNRLIEILFNIITFLKYLIILYNLLANENHYHYHLRILKVALYLSPESVQFFCDFLLRKSRKQKVRQSDFQEPFIIRGKK